jgi:hypothetical protein
MHTRCKRLHTIKNYLLSLEELCKRIKGPRVATAMAMVLIILYEIYYLLKEEKCCKSKGESND